MSPRGYLNISLMLVCILLGCEAVRVIGRPSAYASSDDVAGTTGPDSVAAGNVVPAAVATAVAEAVVTDTPVADTLTPTPTTSAAELPVTRLREADPASMREGHPFAAEARRILDGGLEETDSLRRRRILDYCEHLRTSYTTRDIDFLRQVFSNDALIIVGSTVRTRKGDQSLTQGSTRYSVRSKEEYLARLEKIFRSNRKIDMKFSDFHVSRHPSREGIYGVTLRQRYASDGYADDGYLFLLWDFRDPAMPLIHVRSWQEASDLDDPDDVIGLGDFNLR